MIRSDRAASPLAISLFGSFEVRLAGAPLPPLRSRKGQWLLALLVLRAPGRVERGWLAGTLWPDSAESQALAHLRKSLTDLRAALGSEAARLHAPMPHTLCLDLTGAEADVVAFDQAIARDDAASLERAVSLYRGPLLEGCAEAWVLPEREAREQAYLKALERLAAEALQRGEPGTAERYLRQAVGVDPLRESAQRTLMQALASGGNYAAALLAFRELRLQLHRELNAQPDPESQALFRQLQAEARDRAQAVSSVRASRLKQGHASALASDGEPTALPGFERRALSVERPDTLTFLFTDIAGSTPLWEAHPEAMRLALARHDALLRHAIETHGGHVFKTFGDQFCAVFATAPEALAAAVATQHALQTEGWEEVGPPRVRMALHTGMAEERDGDYFGPALNRIARLLEAGHGGQILLSRATQELARDHLPESADVQDLGDHRLRDLVRPERIYQLVHPALASRFSPLKTLSARPNNLPAQLTPLIGREEDVAAACELLRPEGALNGGRSRLLTLTGPGGTGKTRLGLQVAAELLDEFEDGVYFIGLAPISDPGLVTVTIAQTFGVRDAQGQPLLESLKNTLREKQILLLIDNFEQVIEAAPVVTELLAAAARLKVLVTSRERLHLPGEKELPVSPLALPELDRSLSVEALSRYGAVALLIERAQDVRPDFAVTQENAPAVAEICRRLDGLPLAIELAAARLKLFSPQALLPRLGSRLTLLTGGPRGLPARQQTLRNTIAWSYDLLDSREKILFQRLSVFVGGCTLAAAETVCAAEGDPDLDVLGGLTSLVDKSLLRWEEQGDGQSRFGMLETIREHGRECLAASGEEESIRRRHAQFCRVFAQEAELGLVGTDRKSGCSGWIGTTTT